MPMNGTDISMDGVTFPDCTASTGTKMKKPPEGEGIGLPSGPVGRKIMKAAPTGSALTARGAKETGL